MRPGNPSDVAAVREGRAGIQDEGSQLVILALLRATKVNSCFGQWLDLCAGPGGKSALLAGLANQHDTSLTAVELH
ncbi:rRNA cytosine-C5-methyltransferase, partial [Streptococcus pneumoniae]|nr:rRNA cytosine-C5-methyltransferase [Streptococcus pneumoniae]